MTTRGNDTFEAAGHIWRREWVVAPGEHANAGRYVWRTIVTVYGPAPGVEATAFADGYHRVDKAGHADETKPLTPFYRCALAGVTGTRTYPTLTEAMEHAVAAARRRAA